MAEPAARLLLIEVETGIPDSELQELIAAADRLGIPLERMKAGTPPPAEMDAWQRLVAIVARLRGPEGCPWDREQTPRTLTPYVVEEAHEVVEAIEAGDDAWLLEELGDLLLQVVLQAQLAAEAGRFDIQDVCRTLAEKMIRRHPHVFGAEQFQNMQRHLLRWEELKDAEKRGSAAPVLSGIPVHLPALMRAEKLQQKAARVGFDWPDVTSIRAKITEELDELGEALVSPLPERAEEEFGDLLFALVNWARHQGIRPEEALRGTIQRFSRRFQTIETWLKADGRSWQDLTVPELEDWWQAAK